MTGSKRPKQRMLRRLARISLRAVQSLHPEAGTTPPWERSMLEDVAARRPWNLRVKAERQRALRRLALLQEGVTVIIVNWNTMDVTADVIRRVQELSPPDTRILVVDNGSTDGSRDRLRTWQGIRTMMLRSNAGHGVALDLALCATDTKIAVTLDSDAIPLTSGWLEPAVAPIRDRGVILAGLRSSRNFVHPVYSAVDTAEFLRRRLSFQPFIPPGIEADHARWGHNAWDTSELLTGRLSPDELEFVDPTENAVPGLPGMTAGGVVYHHGGVSRTTSRGVDPEALRGWREACSRLREAVTEVPGEFG